MARGGVGADGFRWRGHEVSRLEGLSDAVLGFAITLLVVSLEVPRTFEELMRAMRGFPAFGVCFALLMHVWYKHYLFFRRFGLQDRLTITLNGGLLFTVLFYVYPLKFMFWLLFLDMTIEPGGARPMLQVSQGRTLLTVYGAGIMAVFSLFALLNLHALRRRAALELNEIEVFETRATIAGDLLHVLVGLISIVFARFLPPRFLNLAAWSYVLIVVFAGLHGWITGMRRRKLVARARAVSIAAKEPGDALGAERAAG